MISLMNDIATRASSEARYKSQVQLLTIIHKARGGDRRDGVCVPDHQLPIHAGRADLGDVARNAFIWPHAGDRVLMQGEQLGLG